jgi:hypothetical protein
MTQLKEVTPDGRVFEVVPISNAKPHEGCVNLLTGLLERAKAGEIRGIVMIACLRDESHEHFMTGRREPIMVLGQLARLSHRVQADADAAMNGG